MNVPIDTACRLPEVFPIFPLEGVLLLPDGRLPLNIFEPRYLNMVEDALGTGRFIGMVQPKGHQPSIVEDACPVFDVGCLGRLVEFSESGDGRFLITLAGVSRFRIMEEISPKNGYRCVRAEYDAFTSDLEEERGGIEDRDRLLRAVASLFTAQGREGGLEGIDNAPDDAVVTSLAMACPFAPAEKQALLECPDMTGRARMLTTLIEMAVQEGNLGNDTNDIIKH